MIPSASPRQRSTERGEITWVTLVLLASLLGGGYLAVVWVPIYLIRYQAGLVATEFANKAIHNPDDDALVKEMCRKLAGLAEVRSPEPDGSISLQPAVNLRLEDVKWERDATSVPRMLHLAFAYTTSVHYPLIDRFSEKTFTIERTQDIQPVKW